MVVSPYATATADQLFAALKAGQLVSGSNAWNALFVGGRPTAAQTSALAMMQVYQTARAATASQLFQLLKAGTLVVGSTVWQALYVSGRATAAETTAAAQYQTYLTYRNATASQLFTALRTGALAVGSDAWTGMLVSGRPTAAQTAAASMLTTYTTLRTATADQLFTALKASTLTIGDDVWQALYVGGRPSPAEATAATLFQGWNTYKNATATQLLDALKTGQLVIGSPLWGALFVNGRQTQAQTDAVTQYQQLSAVSTWVNQLTDTGVKGDITRAAADGVITYGEMKVILDDVKVNGVSVREYNDLSKLLANWNNGITMSSYLHDIFNDVVTGRASDSYWAGSASTGSWTTHSLVGTTQAQMGRLIDKWFVGADLPALGTFGANATYRAATKPLFGANGPSVADINQGYLGDCYIEASLACIARYEPNAIRNMFVDNGNGTYGVRFYMNGKEVWTTVDSRLPTMSNGRLLFNDGPALWASLVEKAYAELNEGGTPNNTAGNSFPAIEGGSADPIEEITGRAMQYAYASTGTTKSQMIAALAANREVWLGSMVTLRTDNNSIISFYQNHAYSVLGYNAQTDSFILRNPWGNAGATVNGRNANWIRSASGSYWTQFEATIADMVLDRAIVAIAAAQPSVGAPRTAFGAGFEDAQANLLVNAMASFAAPQFGATDPTAPVTQDPQNQLAANAVG